MRSRRQNSWRATLGLFVLGWSTVPAPVAATTPTPVCAALLASTPDIPALEQSLTEDPSAVSDICAVEKITPDFTAVDAIVGIVIFPYLIHRLNTAGKPYTKRHGALELAVMRQSQPATTVLLAAGADPVAQTDQTRSALEWGVTLDLETHTTEWTTLLLERWSAEIPPDTLSTHTLDRLFQAPVLATQLHAAGLPPHGVDARGTTWLHRSLYRDEMPFFTRVDLGVPMGKEQQEARAAVSFDAVLARGLPVDQADREGFTALYYAVEAQNWAAFQALLDAGARPEQAGSEPYTILAALARAGDLERFQQMMGRLERAGELSSKDRAALAAALIDPSTLAFCQMLQATGVTPSDAWWERSVFMASNGNLDGALACGLTVPAAAIAEAIRWSRWALVDRLLPQADLTPDELRDLRTRAARQRAPDGVKRALKRAHQRAKGAP